MASLGVDVYRFFISWARLIPLGGRKDPINEKGTAFYNNLIDVLLSRGIKPVVTLYHWDLTAKLYDRYEGFLNTPEFVVNFENFARLCFSLFGNRVRKWITFNEPWVICVFGHLAGNLAPGRNAETGCDPTMEQWRAGHSIILAHAAAVQTYTKEFQAAQGDDISIVLNSHFYEPYDPENEAHVAAARRRLEFFLGWFADPIFLRKVYPACMREQLGSRHPEFTANEFALLKSPCGPSRSFFGLNHYTTQFVHAISGTPHDADHTGNVEELTPDVNGREVGAVSGIHWLRVAPADFRKLLNWIWDRYSVPIIVTDNGCVCPGENNMKVEEAVRGTFRSRYFGLYLDSISRAIYDDGVIIEGYYVWSLMDNFEWSHGYEPRFGVVHVDYETLMTTPKQPAYYLQDTSIERRKGDM